MSAEEVAPYWQRHCDPEACDPKMSEAWHSFMPAAACISLQERSDRTEEARKEFERVGLDDVLFYHPPRDRSTHIPRPGTRGCWESHRAIATWAYQAGLPYILVFEDDVEFVDNFQRKDIDRIRKALAHVRRVDPKWDILYLGHMPLISLPVEGMRSGLRRVHSLATHAYIMSRRLMLWLMKNDHDSVYAARKRPPEKVEIDVCIMPRPGCYAVHPMVCYQRHSESDLRTTSTMEHNARHVALEAGESVFGLIPMAILGVLVLLLAGTALLTLRRKRCRAAIETI